MKIRNLFHALIICCCLTTVQSCDKDSDNILDNEPYQPETSNVSSPKLDKYLTTTDYDGVSFRVRFTNGNDKPENMACTVHWTSFGSKPGKTPSKSDMTKHEAMRQYDFTKYKTTFDKSHAGFSGGTYLYYYFECSNSRHTTSTDVTYCVIKR